MKMNLSDRRTWSPEEPAAAVDAPVEEPTLIGGEPTPEPAKEPDTLIGGDHTEEPKPDDAKTGEPEKTEEKPAETKLDVSALKAPEGFEKLDDEALAIAAPVFEELGITDPAQAQKLVDAYAKAGEKLVNSAFEQAVEAHNVKVKAWYDEAMSDRTINPNEAEFKANMAGIARVLDRFGSPELKDEMKATGLANNPHMVRFCLGVSKAMAEDALHLGSGQEATGPKALHEVLYGQEFQRGAN